MQYKPKIRHLNSVILKNPRWVRAFELLQNESTTREQHLAYFIQTHYITEWRVRNLNGCAYFPILAWATNYYKMGSLFFFLIELFTFFFLSNIFFFVIYILYVVWM